MLKDAWDAVVDGFGWVKAQAISSALEGIEAAFGVECEGTCREVAETVLDVAVAYFTGVPPDLPDSEELLDLSIEQAISLTMAEMGADCAELENMLGVDCASLIREGLEAAYREAIYVRPAPGCVAEDVAHAYGKEPLCFLPGTRLSPAPGAAYRPATAQIGVLRVLDPEPTPGENEFYAVRLTMTGINESAAGMYFFAGENDVRDRCVLPRDRPFEHPLEGELYQSEIVPISALGRMQAAAIPFVLQQYPYEIPGHVSCMHGIGRVIPAERLIQYDRYCLKTGGTIAVRAELMCRGDFMGEWEPCHDSIVQEYSIPGSLCRNFKTPQFFGYP
jgi:hypothetical protein